MTQLRTAPKAAPWFNSKPCGCSCCAPDFRPLLQAPAARAPVPPPASALQSPAARQQEAPAPASARWERGGGISCVHQVTKRQVVIASGRRESAGCLPSSPQLRRTLTLLPAACTSPALPLTVASLAARSISMPAHSRPERAISRSIEPFSPMPAARQLDKSCSAGGLAKHPQASHRHSATQAERHPALHAHPTPPLPDSAAARGTLCRCCSGALPPLPAGCDSRPASGPALCLACRKDDGVHLAAKVDEESAQVLAQAAQVDSQRQLARLVPSQRPVLHTAHIDVACRSGGSSRSSGVGCRVSSSGVGGHTGCRI